MKKLFAAVAISAFALTSIAPVVQAAERSAPTQVTAQKHVHQVAQKKKAKTTKSSKKKATKVSQAAGDLRA
jgi:uncharacterized low-complexity protein